MVKVSYCIRIGSVLIKSWIDLRRHSSRKPALALDIVLAVPTPVILQTSQLYLFIFLLYLAGQMRSRCAGVSGLVTQTWTNAI